MNYKNFTTFKDSSCKLKTWLDLIPNEIIVLTENKLKEKIQQNKENRLIFPYNFTDIFTVFSLCNYSDIKVVIVGQDPYYGNKFQANGIAFSVNSGVSLPPSLKNIFRELPYQRTNGDLSDWVKQGVFLLNTSLTVYEGVGNSHKDVWTQFTDYIIQKIDERDGIIFVLWGAFAQSKREFIKNPQNIILETSHPSPLSVNKTNKPFKNSKIFDLINQHLKTPIHW